MTQRVPHRSVKLVIAERGAGWERWVERYQRDGADVRVVIQTAGESRDRHLQRVRKNVSSIMKRGRTLAAAVLVSDGTFDAGALSSRWETARSVLSAMPRTSRARLLFVSAGRSSRRSMTTFARAVEEEVGRERVAVA